MAGAGGGGGGGGGGGRAMSTALGVALGMGAAALLAGGLAAAASMAVAPAPPEADDTAAALRRKAGGGGGGGGAPPHPAAATTPPREWLAACAPRDGTLSLSELHAVYAELVARDEAGSPPPPEGHRKALDVIDRDVARTFATTGTFSNAAPRAALRRVLAAHAAFDPAVGYVQGLNFVAAFALTHTRPPLHEGDAFALIVRLLRWPAAGPGGCGLRGLFLPGLPGVRLASRVLMAALAEHLPALHARFADLSIDAVFFYEWYFSLFTLVLPPEPCAEVWGALLAPPAAGGGWPAALRVMLALLEVLQPRLLAAPDFHTAVMALKGFNNARLSDMCPDVVVAAAAAPPPPPPLDAGAASALGGAFAAAGSAASSVLAFMQGGEGSGAAGWEVVVGGAAGGAPAPRAPALIPPGAPSEDAVIIHPPRDILQRAARFSLTPARVAALEEEAASALAVEDMDAAARAAARGRGRGGGGGGGGGAGGGDDVSAEERDALAAAALGV